ncbi:hypothetical protein [Pseudodesulfovibrio tunisiensis]|uniref:hypothetical protein n=1 Tax=Pseudodesulfovibrio tunisiensis TaxID=463192 RepID=UPI001FB2D26E|nr:hypothetical protein [Pseudodesulfovibrio tunisiensis]
MKHDPINPGPASGRTLPFDGLGFDLSPVKARAGALVARYALSCREHASRTVRQAPERPGGFDLLVALGREIRGR